MKKLDRLDTSWPIMFLTPNPNETPGFYFLRPYISKDGKLGYKRWKKVAFSNKELKYIFDAIWEP